MDLFNSGKEEIENKIDCQKDYSTFEEGTKLCDQQQVSTEAVLTLEDLEKDGITATIQPSEIQAIQNIDLEKPLITQLAKNRILKMLGLENLTNPTNITHDYIEHFYFPYRTYLISFLKTVSLKYYGLYNGFNRG